MEKHEQGGQLLLCAGQRFVYRQPGWAYPDRVFKLLSVEEVGVRILWGDPEKRGAFSLLWVRCGLRDGTLELLGDTVPGEDTQP